MVNPFGDAFPGAELVGTEKMYVRVTPFNDVECSWNFHRSKDRPKNKADRGQSEKVEENRIRSISRARKMIKRKVVNSGLTYLLTLTYRENVTDLDRMRADRERFCNIVQARKPEWKYLGTYERQKRGAWHAHLAVKGWQDLEMLRRIWSAICGPEGGNVDVKAPRARKDKNARAAMGLYMAKYIGKDLAEWELNRKNYYHSKDVSEPEVYVVDFTVSEKFGAEECAAAIFRIYGREVAYKWVDPTGWMGACSSY